MREKNERAIVYHAQAEAMENGMCDVIKKQLKRRYATRSKIKSPHKIVNLSFKIGFSTAVLIFSGWFPFPHLVASLLYRRIFMT